VKLSVVMFLVLVAVALTTITMGCVSEPKAKTKYYTCPAGKYLLTGHDFEEAGWTIGESSEELPSKLKGKVSSYQCCKIGKLRKDLDVFVYAIFVYSNKTAAESEYEKIKNDYAAKMSVERLNLGDKGFKVNYGPISLYGHEGYVIWILNGNSLIYITCSVIFEDPEDLAEIIINKMNKVAE